MTDPGWTLPTPPDFRLAPTVLSHGAYQCPPFHWDAERERLTRVLRVPGHGARVVEIEEEMVERVEVVGDRDRGMRPTEVRTQVLRIRTPGWEPGEEGRVEVEEAVVFMLALDRDLHEFHELCRSDPALSRIPEAGAGRLLRCPRLWEELAKAICSVGLAWERARSVIEKIAGLGETAQGLHAWPTPEAVLEAGIGALRDGPRTGDPAHRVSKLARRIHAGELDPAPAEAGLLDRDELDRLFRSVEGIDDATAEHLLTLYGHTERLRVDGTVRAFARDRHFGGRTPSDDEVRARYDRYGPWKALAYWFDFAQQVWWPSLGVEF